MSKALTTRGKMSLQPQNFTEAVEFSSQVANTSFVPDSFRGKPDEILAAIQYGSELGLSPLTSLNSLAVIKGKVTMYANTMRALVDASGLMSKCVVEWDAEKLHATVIVQRVGREEAASHSFGLADAKAAGLAGRDMYKKYPKQMYVSRAMSFAMRYEFADVLKGIMGAEEMGDVVDPSEDDVEILPQTTTATDDNDEQVVEDVNKLLGVVDDYETENGQLLVSRLREGFRLLEWSPVQQRVQLLQYNGREGDLLEHMIQTKRTQNGESNGG